MVGDKEELILTSTKETQRLFKTPTGKSNGVIPVVEISTQEEVTTKILVIIFRRSNAKLHVTKLVQRFAMNSNLAKATLEVLAEHGLEHVAKLLGSTLRFMSDLVQQSTRLATALKELPNASHLLTEQNMPNTINWTSEEETSEERCKEE